MSKQFLTLAFLISSFPLIAMQQFTTEAEICAIIEKFSKPRTFYCTICKTDTSQSATPMGEDSHRDNIHNLCDTCKIIAKRLFTNQITKN